LGLISEVPVQSCPADPEVLRDVLGDMTIVLHPAGGGDVSVPWILRGRPNLVPLAREVIRP
jgi:hypothetical protein